MTEDALIIRGLAHRGNCDPEIAQYVAGAVPTAPSLWLYPEFNGTVIGDAVVNVRDNGDVAVEAQVPLNCLKWLMDFPFLALAIKDSEEGPREIIQVAVTRHAGDPLQLPYRILQLPDQFERQFFRDYEQVVVVDEPHDAPVQLSDDGSVAPVFDIAKSHIELRHRSERIRTAIPHAVARGFGFDNWDEIEHIAWGDTSDGTPYVILREVMATLR